MTDWGVNIHKGKFYIGDAPQHSNVDWLILGVRSRQNGQTKDYWHPVLFNRLMNKCCYGVFYVMPCHVYSKRNWVYLSQFRHSVYNNDRFAVVLPEKNIKYVDPDIII